jgi:hypothetical protein
LSSARIIPYLGAKIKLRLSKMREAFRGDRAGSSPIKFDADPEPA